MAGLFLGDIQGCQIGRAVLGRPLSVLLSIFGHTPFWGVIKRGWGKKYVGCEPFVLVILTIRYIN